jgi:hypothetical protein
VGTRDVDDLEPGPVFKGVAARQRPRPGEHHPRTGGPGYRLALSGRDADRTDQALDQLAIVRITWINRFVPDSQLAIRAET